MIAGITASIPPSGGGPTDTGWLFVTVGAQSAGGGDKSWSVLTLPNITADDTSYAECSNLDEEDVTYELQGTMGTNLFAIPSGATIDGIEVEYGGYASSNSQVNEDQQRLIIGGIVDGYIDGSGVLTTTTTATYTVGGPTNLWGLVQDTDFTVTQLNALDFGVALQWEQEYREGDNRIVYIDYYKIKIHYTT